MDHSCLRKVANSAVSSRLSTRKWIFLAVLLIEAAILVHFFSTVRRVLAQQQDGPGETPTAALTDRPTLTAQPSETPLPTETPQPTETPVPTITPTPSPTPLPGEQVTVSGARLQAVYIPGGKFRMGSTMGSGGNDHPRHTVILNGFWMSRTQVTNAMYAACVEAGGCTRPIRKEINPHYYDPKYADHPVVYVTWYQAEAFCSWAGGRLPSEAEWERSAGGHIYAWGDEDPGPKLANVGRPRGGTKKVGSYPAGASRYGVLDLGGNVREWVNDWYGPSYYRKSPEENPQGPVSGEKRVLRGAAWHDPVEFSRVWKRLAHVPDSPGANRGFRCAFDQVYPLDGGSQR